MRACFCIMCVPGKTLKCRILIIVLRENLPSKLLGYARAGVSNSFSAASQIHILGTLCGLHSLKKI